MKTIVVYDSQYGSTEQIAKAIGKALGEDTRVVKVGEANVADLGFYNLIIIGSPTQGGRHTMAMKHFLDSIPADALKGKRLAAFDTRLKTVFVKLFGWAATRIETAIKEKGGNSTAQPQGFFVKSAKGPLVDGELERAAAWAKAIAAGVPTSQMPGEYQQKKKE